MAVRRSTDRNRRARTSPQARQAWSTAICALLAISTPASPVGSTVADAVWVMVIAGLAAYCGSTAKRMPLLFGVCVTLAGASSPTAFGIALVALAFAGLATRHLRRRTFFMRGMAGGLVANSVLVTSGHAPGVVTAIVATAAVVPVVASGLRHAEPDLRRRMVRSLVVLGVGCVVASSAAVVGVALSRGAIDSVTDEMRRGFSAARSGEIDVAARSFDRAAADLESAGARIARWGSAARVVPVAGQHVDAVTAVFADVEEVAERATRTASLTNSEDLTVTAGMVDLDAIAALENPLSRLATALDRVVEEVDRRTDEPLLDVVQHRLDVIRQESARAGQDASRGARVAAVLPELLGRDGPKRYLVLFTSAAEARGRFGFPGSFAEVVFTSGRMRLLEQDTTSEVLVPIATDQSAFDVDDPLLRPYLGLGPTREFRSVTIPADFPTVAATAAQLWEQSGRAPVDGVLRFDPASLAPLLDYTGPVQLDDVDEILTSANLAQFLVFDQYLQFADETAPRREALDTVAEVTFERLETASLPGPRQLVDRYGPLAAQGHLNVVPFHAEALALFDEIGLSGRLGRPDTDALLVTNVNSVANKIDTFLERSIRYRATIEDGMLRGALTVTLRNGAPPSGLPFYVIGSLTRPPLPLGTNRTTLLLYTRVPVDEVRVDGVPRNVRSVRIQGRWMHQVVIELPPGATGEVELALMGPAPDRPGLLLEPGGGAQPDHYDVEIVDGRTGSFSYRGAVHVPTLVGT